MTFEELKNGLKEIQRQEALCERRYVQLREKYKRQNAPIKIKNNQMITVVLRVTEDTRRYIAENQKAMRKYQVGYEYSVTGYFQGWYIHEEGHGELKPCFYGDVYYSRYDDVVSIKIAEHQPEGSCTKCRHYKDGLCYMHGGKEWGKQYANHKVKEGDLVCPKYEEVLSKGLYEYGDSSRYCPNVTVRKDDKGKTEYRVYSLNWNTYEKYSEKNIFKFFTKEPKTGNNEQQY